MKTKKLNSKNLIINFEYKRIKSLFTVFFYLSALMVCNSIQAQNSMQTFADNNGKKLAVYSDVPGHSNEEFLKSDKYTIRVRSALTNNQWVNSFAHYTFNKARHLKPDGLNIKRANFHYVYDTDGWSHTFANIEITPDTPVEVEITWIGPHQLAGKPIEKAAAYPVRKVSKQPTIENGKIYFTVNNPGQITIDINGQMDDHHFISKPLGKPVHAISFFANPIMEKPSLTDPNVIQVKPGEIPSSNMGSKTIMYFLPGVHKIDMGFKVYPGKSYYIPGDAVIYGAFNNLGVSGSGGLQSGENIKIFGYGTLNTSRIVHPDYFLPDGKGGYINNDANQDKHSPILIYNCINTEINGISLTDAAFHSIKLFAASTTKIPSINRWVKIIAWRANGDGIGRTELIEDCFIRTQDDASYLKGDRKRVVFWRDNHAAAFHMASAFTDPMVIEDCDIIYHRDRDGTQGGVFHQRGSGTGKVLNLQLTVRNFISSDKLANAPFFNMEAGGQAFKGITFKNIEIASSHKQVLEGSDILPYNGGITFECVTVGGKLVTAKNFTEIFKTNQYVTNLVFKDCSNLRVSDNELDQSNVLIYPNPVSSILNIDFPEAGDREIKIINILGQEIYSAKTSNKSEQIDVKNLNFTGVGFLKVNGQNGSSSQKIIVK